MSENLNAVFIELAKSDSMTSVSLLERLYNYAKGAATHGTGTIVEIGAYRGASTVALALGVQSSGRGHVYSIDPHKDFRGVLGGVFSPEDHLAFEVAIHKHNVAEWVSHHCSDSSSVAQGWTEKIDLLWIDGDHSYEGVATDLKLWLPYISDGGILVLDDHSPGSEVEEAVRDHLPFSRYISIERIGDALILRRTSEPRSLVLCGGMQSSGSTLVSMCFLQRQDMDGVYDLDNPFIQQDFSRVFTSTVWVKMTIGSFRLGELADFYAAQGWLVRTLLVYRNPEEIMKSLVKKWYGADGCTGDDPPLFIRLARYMADIDDAKSGSRPILYYRNLLQTPMEELTRICLLLNLPWDSQMMVWPKQASAFAYPSLGNESLRASFASESGLIETIINYKIQNSNLNGQDDGNLTLHAKALVASILKLRSGTEGIGEAGLMPSRFRGTRRYAVEQNIVQLIHEKQLLNDEKWQLREYVSRIMKHAVIGRFIRTWTTLINPNLTPPHWRDD
jgi:predicted O-methyltransferase YrrM